MHGQSDLCPAVGDRGAETAPDGATYPASSGPDPPKERFPPVGEPPGRSETAFSVGAQRGVATARSIPWAVWIAVGVYAALFTYASWVRFTNLEAGAFDLGVNVQAMATARGGVPLDRADFMLYSGALGPNFFGVHFSPIFYVLSPIAAVVPAAPALFALQWIGLGLGAPLVYLIARDAGVAPRLATLLALAYLAYPPTIMAGAYDVHMLAFVPLIELLLYRGLTRGSWSVSAIALALAVLAEEGAVLLAAFVAAQALLDTSSSVLAALNPLRWPRRQRQIALVAVVAIVSFGLEDLATNLVAPARNGELFVNVGHSLALSDTSIGPMVKAGYWYLLLGFAGFLPLIGVRRMVAIVPSLALSVFSVDLNFSMLQWQYSFLAVPAIFLGAIEGTLLVQRWLPRAAAPLDRAPSSPARRASNPRRRLLGALPYAVVVVVVGAGVLYSPLLPYAARLPNSRSFTTLEPPGNTSALRSLIAEIPSNAPLVASEFLFAQVATDPNAYPLLVYSQGGPVGPLGHLPSGFVPSDFLLFPADAPYAQELYGGFPANYTLTGSVVITPGAPLWSGDGAPTASETVELFVQSPA